MGCTHGRAATLSFLTYFVLKKPEVLRKLRAELDEVLGNEPPLLSDLNKLPYLAGASSLIHSQRGVYSLAAACLRETLRMGPAAPMRAVEAQEDTTIGGGKYAVRKGQTIAILTAQALRDLKVWGEDVSASTVQVMTGGQLVVSQAEVFNPDRMMDGKFEALPVGTVCSGCIPVLTLLCPSTTPGSPSASACAPASYVRFSSSHTPCWPLTPRTTQGRAFAWQEMMLVSALVFQRFDVTLDDPSYELVIKQTLTIKPKDFRIRVALRADRAPPLPRPSTFSARSGKSTSRSAGSAASGSASPVEAKQPVYVMYGSNTGTSETFAQRIVNDAAARGMFPLWVYARSSDRRDNDRVPREHGGARLVRGQAPDRRARRHHHCILRGFVTPSPAYIHAYPPDVPKHTGEPADNAAHFVDWLTNLPGPGALAGVRFAVFGCGNRDWVNTYQRIPALVDATLEARGAQRLVERGAGDASGGDFFEVFDEWEAGLWETLSKVGWSVIGVDGGC